MKSKNRPKVFRSLLVLLLITLTINLLAQSTSTLVYYTPNGEKYHKKDCRTLARSKVIHSATILEAKKLGLEACKVCKPGE